MGNLEGSIFKNELVEIDIYFLLINLIIAYFLSYLLKVYYNKYGSSISNRSNFSKNFIILTLTIVLVISIVKSSLALSLGLVGALSIVRFRTPIKDPEELAYLFLCIATGLGLGANQTIPTILSFSLILFLIFVTKKLNANQEDSKGVYLNLTLNNVNKKNSASTIKKINSILKSSKKECELRRLDIENNTVDASYLVIIANVEEPEFSGAEIYATKTKFKKNSFRYLSEKGSKIYIDNKLTINQDKFDYKNF